MSNSNKYDFSLNNFYIDLLCEIFDREGFKLICSEVNKISKLPFGVCMYIWRVILNLAGYIVIWLFNYIVKPYTFVVYIVHIQAPPHVGNHIVAYADDNTIYTVKPRPLSRPQGIKSLNQNLAAIETLCLKWHVSLKP